MSPTTERRTVRSAVAGGGPQVCVFDEYLGKYICDPCTGGSDLTEVSSFHGRARLMMSCDIPEEEECADGWVFDWFLGVCVLESGGGEEPPDDDGSGGGSDDDPPDDTECDPDFNTCLESIAVECDQGTVIRGHLLDCHLETVPETANNFEVVGWSFQGGGFTVNRTSGVTSHFWAGTVVVGGEISAQYQLDGSSTVDTATASSFSVTPRTNGWSWTATSTVLPHDTWPISEPLATTNTLGLTCWIDNQAGPCGSAPVAPQPWPSLPGTPPSGCLGGSGHGFRCEPVTGGPNDGLWYISDAYWMLNRRSGIHPDFSESRPFSPLLGCDPDDGSGTWAAYHDACRGLDGSGFVAGLEAHELGHVQQADNAAATGMDPVAEAEAYVNESETDLLQRVAVLVRDISNPIVVAGQDHPTGNFDPGTDEWSFWDGVLYGVLRQMTPF